jgi:hypothetical protein
MASILDRIRYNESRGVPTAKNPYSSAGGLYQFLDTTWGSVLRRMDPQQFGSMTNAQLAPLKTDPRYVDLQNRAAEFHLTRDIQPTLERSGVPNTPGTAYLGWFQGPAGAAKLYNSPAGTRIADIFPETIKANANMKFNGKPYADWTREDAINWANTKMGGAQAAAVAQPAPVMPENEGGLFGLPTNQQAQVSTPQVPPPAPVATPAPASTPEAPPVYANDFGTAMQYFGSMLGLAEAPQPLQGAEAEAQRRANEEARRQLAALGEAQKSFGILASAGAAPQTGVPNLLAQEDPQRRITQLPYFRGLI